MLQACAWVETQCVWSYRHPKWATKGWQSAHGAAQQVALRCRLVLAAADGKQDLEIAAAFRVSRHTASLWRRRVHEKGVGAVWEIEKGRGRKPQFDQARRDAITAATLERNLKEPRIGVVVTWLTLRM